MSDAEFRAYLAQLAGQHGGFVNAVQQKGQARTDENGVPVEDPSQTYRYLFADGMYVDAKGVSSGDSENSQAKSYELQGGTAMKPPTAAAAAAKGAPNTLVYIPGTMTPLGMYDSTGTYRDLPNAAAATKPAAPDIQIINGNAYRVDPNGNMTLVQDKTLTPGYQAPAVPQGPAPKPAKGATRLSTQSANGQVYTIQEIADGMGGWSVDPSYKAQVAIGKETPGNLVAINDPSTGKPFAMRDPVTGTVTLLPKDTATTPGEDAYQGAQTAFQQAQTAKIQRDMQPGAMKAIQDMYDSIGAVQGMMEKGTMTPAEGSSYMEAFQANTMAALQGSTPWEMKTTQQTEDRNRADIGRQLLNQKLSSSSGIANSLLGVLGSVGGKLANIPGGVHFDPFGMAAQFTDEQSGGQEMSDLAKTLLGQLKPQGAPMAQPAAAPQAAGSSPVMSAMIQMLAAQPDLARNNQAQAAPTYQGDSQGSTIGGVFPPARDGQTYGTQSPDVRAGFQGMYGNDAPIEWMKQHNAALGG